MSLSYKYPPGERHVPARYSTGIGSDENNPLSASLQPTWNTELLANALTWWPEHGPSCHGLNADARLDLTYQLQDGFEAMPQHITIIRAILNDIRRLYCGRDVFVHSHTEQIQARAAMLASSRHSGVRISGTSTSFLIYGLPGTGKTSLSLRLGAVLPQVIDHIEFQGRPWPCRQVTYLRVAAQQNWTDKAIAQAILLEFDKVAGTNYTAEVNRGSSPSAFKYLMQFSIASNNHGLGALILDEVQLLKSDTTLLNFVINFTSLNNVLLVLVGTPASVDVIGEDPRFMRRADAVFDPELKRFEFPTTTKEAYEATLNETTDEIDCWTWFILSFWHRQYTAQAAALTYELSHHLHWLSAGLPGYATKIFIGSQLARIGTAKDYLDKEALNQAYSAFNSSSKEYLDDLRHDRKLKLAKFADFAGIDFANVANAAALARLARGNAGDHEPLAKTKTGAEEEKRAKVVSNSKPRLATAPKPAPRRVDQTELPRASTYDFL